MVSTNNETPRETFLSLLDLSGYLHFCKVWLVCFISLTVCYEECSRVPGES